MLKLQEVMAGGDSITKIYCQGTVCLRCVLAVLHTVKLGLTKVGNQAKPLKYSENKVVFRTNLEWIFFYSVISNQSTWVLYELMCWLSVVVRSPPARRSLSWIQSTVD